MKEYIKPPTLSTGFSQSGKSARKRFENILNTKAKKTGAIAFVIVICIVLSVGTLLAWNNNHSISIIGGSDGPTSIYLSGNIEKYIKSLYDSKIRYIGNNSGVAKIAELLPFAEGVKLESIKLQTDSKPYGAILNYTIDDYDKAVTNNTVNTVKADGFYKNAILMLCLIDNADSVTVNIKDEILYKGAEYSYTYLRADLDNVFHKPLREFGKDLNSFTALFTSISSKEYGITVAVSSAILNKKANSYLKGECAGEGHIILGTKEAGGNTEVYLLAVYAEYGFINGNFEMVSGSGIIPTKITFEALSGGTYNILEYKEAEFGGGYTKSVKEIFPEEYWDRTLSIRDEDAKECERQRRTYAESYLKSINRGAQIGYYSDFEHEIPNINTNISNSLSGKFYEYPSWIGTLEKIEENVRYVYEKMWNDKGGGRGVVTFKKYEYDSKRVIEEFVIEILDDEIIYLKNMPSKE